jgi:hypothetical protein
VNSFTLSPIISERERAENLCGERKKEDLFVFEKKEKKAESREKRVKKQKKWNNEFLHALVIRFRRVV